MKKSFKINGYNFIKYDKRLIKHINRHISGSKVPGSYFKKSVFPNAMSLIKFALKHIKSYNGKIKFIELNMPKVIGYDSIIARNKIPKTLKIRQKKRERAAFSYPINYVKGIAKKPTKNIVIAIGPLSKNSHGILSIFPGKNYPPFPQTKKQLEKMGHKGKQLKKQIIRNKKLLKIWDKLVFVV